MSASGLPAPAADSLRARVRDYTSEVLRHDWPEMKRGTMDGRSDQLLTRMSTFVLQVNAQTSAASNAQQYVLGQLSVLASARAQREDTARSRLPLGVLAAVIVTSLIVCLFPFAGGMKSAPACVVLAVLQAALLLVPDPAAVTAASSRVRECDLDAADSSFPAGDHAPTGRNRADGVHSAAVRSGSVPCRPRRSGTTWPRRPAHRAGRRPTASPIRWTHFPALQRTGKPASPGARRAGKGLPLIILLVVVLALCVVAAVTKYARNR